LNELSENIFVLRMHHFFFLDSIANIDNPSIVRVVAATFLLPYIVVELKVLKEKYVFYETQRSQAGTHQTNDEYIPLNYIGQIA